MEEAHKNLTDEELVVKSRENIDYFEQLIERYERKLLLYIMRISSFRENDAEEILQEVFIKAWKNINAFDEGLSFSSWMYRIAHNQTVSTFRKISSRGLDKQDSLDDHVFHLKDKSLGAHELVERIEDSERVKKALLRMPQKYRDIIVLYYFEDLSYKEIADVLKRSEGSVATQLHRAKKKLQILIEKE